VSLYSQNGCDTTALFDSIRSELVGKGCIHDTMTEILLLTGAGSPEAADQVVSLKCREMWDREYAKFLSFVDIPEQESDTNFIKSFYDGDTYWNHARETSLIDGVARDILAKDPGERIAQIYSNISQSRGLRWPGDESIMTNFQNCSSNAVMCCWVQDRQAQADDPAGAGNGNCDLPYDVNCIDADPMDNTDICYVDMSRSPASSRVNGGFAVFPGDSEGEAHCHGFAWADDENDFSAQYKANNLFYVSMYDHLTQRGYVKNVPGSPMCGCVEQMPVVTRADCTELIVWQVR